ncbi:MAG: excinuclease ABC subunit C [Verrucomicrobiales bacterium]|jgi:excinuclease ABC subunit C
MLNFQHLLYRIAFENEFELLRQAPDDTSMVLRKRVRTRIQMSTPSRPDLKIKLRDVPHKPGVYLMKDRLDRIIYVGKAKSLRKRLSNYFTPSRSRMADIKTRALIKSIWDFEIHVVRNEPESLLLEGKLIKEYRPKYNVSFRDDKRFLLLKVHMDDPYPRFQFSRIRKEDGSRYFGPFAHSGALRTTINWMNKEFGLRNCRPLFPTENDYKHCNDDVIKNCSAPCIARISEEEYKERVEKACEFLQGRSKEMIEQLQIEMETAAHKLDFERAAELRDMLDQLRKTLSPARQFRRGRGAPRTGDAIDPMADVRELREVLMMGREPLVMECFDISNISDTHCVASMVRFRNGAPDTQNYRRYRIKTVQGQDDFAAMAEVVRRRYSRILLEARDHAGDDAEASQLDPVEALRRLEEEVEARAAAGSSAKKKKSKSFVRLPDLVIVDGGKGQLSSACKELQRLGLQDLPIIGLAKQREEIFRPHESDPIVLDHGVGALKMLQRIRDEAHRWANGYNEILMKRRVSESILDDCPGISSRRKSALLEAFGSVARLRKAGVDKIAAVSGISQSLAEGIVRFLESHR